MKSLSFVKGEKILRPKVKTAYLHEIRHGFAKLYTLDKKGREKIGAIYGPGNLFPLAWIINQDKPAVYFEALTTCEVNLIAFETFLEEVNNNAELSQLFTQRVVEQFALYATTVNNLGFKQGDERLTYRLLVLASRFGSKTKGGIRIPRIANHDLGAIVNLTRESVSREMSKLMRLGVIEVESSSILIKDSRRLQDILGEEVSIIFFDNI